MSIFIVNWMALLLSCLWALALGMIWYSPRLFFPLWQSAQGITDEQMKEGSPGKSMVVGLIANSLSLYFLGVLFNLAGPAGWAQGLGLSLLVSLGLIELTEINNGSFRMTRPVVYFIDGGYRVLALAGSGLLYTLL